MTDLVDLGITIVSNNSRAISRAKSVTAPIMRGLEYLNFYCGDTGNLTRNLVRGKPAGRVIGKPIPHGTYTTFNSSTNYIDSGVAHTDSMSMICLAKAPNPKEESVLMSNFKGIAPGGGVSQGTGMMFRPNQFYYNNAVVNADGSKSLFQSSLAYNPGTWALAESRSSPQLNGGNVWLNQDGTSNAVAYGLPAGARVDIGGNIMIGSLGGLLGSVNGKPSDIAMAAIFSVALSADEVAKFRAWVREVLKYQFDWTPF